LTIMDTLRNVLRRSLANPTRMILRAFGAMDDSPSGIDVTPENALTHSAVYASIRNISDDIAKMSLHLYEREPGGRRQATDHPLYPILHDAANPHMTAIAFRSTMTGHALTWGNAYAQIIRNNAGQITALYPLRPDRMTVTVNKEGDLEYLYHLESGAKPLSRSQVFHLPGFGFDGLRGYSMIALARDSIGLGMAQEKFGAKLFGNGARPGGYLKHPGKLSQPAHDRLVQAFENRHQGVDNSHRVAVLEEGMEFQSVGIPPEDAQFLESRKFQIAEIARWFRMPLHKLQEMGAATFSNIEHQSLEYVMDTLLTWAVLWEQNISLQLLGAKDRGRLFAKHNLNSLLRADFKTRMDGYNVARQGGWMSANEIRALEEMNALPPEIGDVVLVNGNMIPVDSAGQRSEPPPPPSPTESPPAPALEGGDDK
jgi:HK97 family phage portal protein